MTERFKKAVKSYVADGVLTSEEKEDLRKIAKEEQINATDADIFINAELTKIRSRKQTRKEVVETIKEIGGVVVSVGGFVLSIFVLINGNGKK